jgi:ferredoxin
MIANYGYEDGSGYYYITIDGDICARCESHACVAVCPGKVYAIEMDDYDEMVAVVADSARRRLRELCSGCKGQNGSGGTEERRLPCISACPGGAIRHSW